METESCVVITRGSPLVKDNRPVIWRIRLFTLSVLYLAPLWDKQRGPLQKRSRNITSHY